jgi:hypothetical protein
MPDARSPLTTEIINANPRAYEALVVEGGTSALATKLLEHIQPEQLITAPANAKGMLAGLWLWHDGLEESHRISQAMDDSTGSFWHAIMHRREGDFSNSKYWYARAAGHPALTILAGQAGAMVNAMPADKHLLRLVVGGWNPNALVDLIESVHENPNDPLRSSAVQLQHLEWRILFEHCARVE